MTGLVSVVSEPLRCLKVADEWLQLILHGPKDLELRRTNCKVRGRIALGNTKTKLVEGYCNIDRVKEFSLDVLRTLNHRHCANNFLNDYAIGRDTLFAWFLSNMEVEPNPFPYTFSTGCWCFTRK